MNRGSRLIFAKIIKKFFWGVLCCVLFFFFFFFFINKKKKNQKKKSADKCGLPTFSSYSVVGNDVMRFGSGTEVFGPIHSNNGIRFDGLTHNIITSTVSQYDDPDSDDCNGN